MLDHLSADIAREELQTAYGDIGRVVPALLQRAQDVPDLYVDSVSQVVEQKQRAGRRLARWVVPDTSLRVSFQAFSLRAAGWPVLARVIKRQFGLGRGIKL